MGPAAVLVAVLAVSCHAVRMASGQSAAPNQQTGPKPLLGIVVSQPTGEQIWPVQTKGPGRAGARSCKRCPWMHLYSLQSPTLHTIHRKSWLNPFSLADGGSAAELHDGRSALRELCRLA